MLTFPKWKVIMILLVCVLGSLLAVPNFLNDDQIQNMPSFMQNKVNLGLDLQGGIDLRMQVDINATITDKLNNKKGDIRGILSDKTNGRISSRRVVKDNKIIITLKKPEQMEEALKRIATTIEPIGDLFSGGSVPDILIEDKGAGRIEVVLSEAGRTKRIKDVISQSIKVLRRRIDPDGTVEPTIQQQGEDRIIIQVPGVKNIAALKSIIGKTAKMTFHMVNMSISPKDVAAGRVPPGTKIFPSAPSNMRGGSVPRQYALKTIPILSGENLVDASISQDESNRPAVGFRFDTVGGKKFANITKKNRDRLFAIVLDGEVISAPRINGPILGGSGIITGSFTSEEAYELALLLKAGALPTKLESVYESTVGADLGADSIEAGKIASIIGLLAVMAYILLSYGWFGMVTNIALVVNIMLIFGVLSIFGATLTLPGIAGIVLTVGMAVDANVLIFERIREELRAGKKVLQAIEIGYQKAFMTIIDANVTTFIAAVMLFQFGSGPVKGFAVTLMCGIVTSVFTAVSLTRLIIASWARSKRPETLKL
jgi:protein-export membrane protein SecD